MIFDMILKRYHIYKKSHKKSKKNKQQNIWQNEYKLLS